MACIKAKAVVGPKNFQPRDFSTVANNACILEQTLHIIFIKAGDLMEVEVVKSGAKVVAFIKNRAPA